MAARALLRLALVLMLALAGGLAPGAFSPAIAEQQDAIPLPDYEAWEKVAARAEEAVDAARASTVALEALRSELAGWRDRFQQAQELNKTAIATVRSQLEALGPPPENGEEAPEIATQRKALEERLAELEAPVKAAQVAYSRADSLIRGIDKIIRERQANALLELGPSPLNPAHWGPALGDLITFLSDTGHEFVTAWESPVQRAEFRKNLPAVLLFAVVALVLLLRGRRWMERLAVRVQDAGSGSARWFLGFALSLGQVLLPLIGLVSLVLAVYASGLVGLRTDLLLSQLPQMGAIFFMALWLGSRAFPKYRAHFAPLDLTDAQRRAGRFYSGLLGLMLALNRLIDDISQYEGWAAETVNTLKFPIVALCALALFRIGQILLSHSREAAAEGGAEGEAAQEGAGYRRQVIRFLGRVLIAVSVIGVVAGGIGYMRAAEALVFPTALSLALLAFILVLLRVLTEIYALIIGDEKAARESLVTTLTGFVMMIASLPLFALIWGARVSDLAEIWARFREGFTIGDTHISPGSFIAFVIIFTIGYMLTRLIQGMLKASVLPKTKIDPGGQNAIVSGIGYLGIFLSAVIAITAAGIDLSSLAIVAGALSVGIGFGLQNIVSNFVSGIILLIERPIAEGDWIEVGGKMGYVRDISVRSTRIETFDRTDVIVPNSDLVSGMVTNWTRGNSVGRIIVPVGVAYGTDTRKVEKILREIAEAHPMVLVNPPPGVVFQGFGADSLDFEIRAILRDVNFSLSVKSDLNHEIARRFAEEGIEIPFAQRDIWLRNPESLKGVCAPGGARKVRSGKEAAGAGKSAGAKGGPKSGNESADDEG